MKKFKLTKLLSILGALIFMLILTTSAVQALHLHIYSDISHHSATCTTKGYIQVKCSCGSTKKLSYTDKLGHNYKTTSKEATCTEDGFTKTVCSRCKYVKTDKILKAKGHKTTTLKAVKAKCTSTGLTAGKQCKNCGVITVKQEVVPKTAHKTTTLKAVKATCTKTGLTAGKQCKTCGEVTVKQEVVPKTAHKTTTLKAVKATCTTTGLTAGKKCKTCGEVTVKQEVVPKTAHKTTTLKAVKATCTNTGLTAGKKCKTCGLVTVKQEVTPKIDHKITTKKAVKATCTSTGLTAGKYCKTCGLVTVAQEVVPMKEHKLTTVKAVAPTCTEQGFSEGKKCSVCDTLVSTQNVVPALGHNMITDKAVTATCTKTGLTEGKHCSRCDAVTVKQEVVKALGHNMITDKAVAATCTKTGLTEGKHCSRCNDVTVKQETIKALGHNMITDKAVAATCTKDGLTEGKHCSRCDAVIVKQEVVKALGHDIVIDKAVPADCDVTGLTEGKHCSRCNDMTVKQEVIPATGISIWDGKTYTQPKTEGDYLVINYSHEFAWVLKNQNLCNKTKLKINHNIDMAGKTLASFPAGVIVFEGNGKYIKNLVINGTGLFGDSTGINVSQLTLDNVKVTSNTSAGVMVGTLKGNSTFTNCIVKNSSAVAKAGYAGGFVGYIVRATETDRASSLDVAINGCNIEKSTINGTLAEGKFVGALSGYDNKETLSFANSIADTTVNDYVSRYINTNQSVFLEAINERFNGFVGTEKYFRGVITFDGLRFIPKWDGTSVEPLLAHKTYDGITAGANIYVVYSPYDLAGIRAKTAAPVAIHFKSDVDMNGQGADGKFNVPNVFAKSKNASADDINFTPFNTVGTLDGANHTIYNMAICELEKNTGAFILSASGTTVHKNINFNNCQTVSTHKVVKTDAKAYGAILVANAGGTKYTMENVTATNCRVFALQKVGTLAGAVMANNNYIKNNTVTNCYVENYECNISETFDSGKKYIDDSRWIRVKATFYPQGEVGGMIGFVMKNAEISGCKVNGTIVHAYGQSDKMATVEGSRLGKLFLSLGGYYQVPGRHVSTFIGDIRSTGNVKITNCTVDSASKCTNRWDKHNATYTYIGQAYYVYQLDKAGSVTVNGNKLVLADCSTDTKR